MYISKEGARSYLYRIGELDVNAIHKLDQKERKFILHARKAADWADKNQMLNTKEPEVHFDEEAKDLIRSIQKKASKYLNSPQELVKTKHSNFFVSFFKGLGNMFSWRVPTSRVISEIQALKKDIDDNDKRRLEKK